MAYIGKAAEEPIMPFTSVFILARAFGCATTNWSIGGLVEKLDSGTWGTATWDHAVGGATSLQNKRGKSPVCSRKLFIKKIIREGMSPQGCIPRG